MNHTEQALATNGSSALKRTHEEGQARYALSYGLDMHTSWWSGGVPRKSVPSVYLLFLPKYSGTQVPMLLYHRNHHLHCSVKARKLLPALPARRTHLDVCMRPTPGMLAGRPKIEAQPIRVRRPC